MSVSLVLATLNPKPIYLKQALDCRDLFSETLIHLNSPKDQEWVHKLVFPELRTQLIVGTTPISAGDAFNDIINRTSTQWVLPICDDDFFNRENLIKILEITLNQNHHADIIHYPVYVGNNDIWDLWGNKPNPTFEELKEQNSIPFSCIYKKELWTKLRGYKNVPFSDWFFYLEALKANAKLHYVDIPVYYHRQDHKNSLANKQAKTFSLTKVKEIFTKELDKSNG